MVEGWAWAAEFLSLSEGPGSLDLCLLLVFSPSHVCQALPRPDVLAGTAAFRCWESSALAFLCPSPIRLGWYRYEYIIVIC